MNLPRATSYFLVPFSGFFLVNVLPISPIYFFLIGAYFLFFSSILSRQKIYWDSVLQLLFVYFIYTIGIQIFLSPDLSAFLNIILNFLFFFPTVIILKRLRIYDVVHVCKILIWFSIILLSIEAIYRLTNPIFFITGESDYREMEGMMFYAYKLNSIMFQDSNFVGIYVMIVFFLNLFLFKNRIYQSKFSLFFLFILILLTLSRSAIISTVTCIFLLPVLLNAKNNPLKIIGGLLIGLLMYIFIAPIISGDMSYLSKFKIIEITFSFLEQATFQELLFGVGFGNSYQHLGMGGHNLFVTYIVESGISGLIFFLYFHLYIFYKTKRLILYITLPLFITGFSLVGHAIPFYYVSLAIIYLFSKKIHINNGTYLNFNSYL